MKATVKTGYHTDKGSASGLATISFPAGDALIKASVTDATVVKGRSMEGLLLSVEKPGSFIIGYDVPKQDFRFQFMNTVRVADKPVSLTYAHHHGGHRVSLDGSVAFDPANKVSMSYGFGPSAYKVKYTYAHGELRRTLFEPAYDWSKNAWDFTASTRFDSGDAVKATYQSSTRVLGLEWNKDTKLNGSFKVSAQVNLAEERPIPKVMAESTWNFEM